MNDRRTRRGPVSAAALVSAVLVLGVMGAGCTTTGSSRSSSGGSGAGSSGSCADQFKAALPGVEGVDPIRRVTPALAALGTGCPAVLGALGDAAVTGQALDRDDRAAMLAAAAADVLPPACAAPTPVAPAASITWSCPPPEGMVLADQLLGDLDAGTYLFAVAVRARLDGANALDDSAKRLLDNLLLGAALEGEQARQAAPNSASQ